jgi:hypothetical protein
MRRAPIAYLSAPRAILLRLLAMVALALFGMPQGHPNGALAKASPVAQAQLDQAQTTVSTPRYLLRAQTTDDQPSDAVVPVSLNEALHISDVQMRPARQSSFAPVAVRILPPVRGPPVV